MQAETIDISVLNSTVQGSNMSHSSLRTGHRKYVPTALGMLIASGFLPSFNASSQILDDNGTRQDHSPVPAFSDLRSLFTITSVLRSNPQWQTFKMLWKKLDSMPDSKSANLSSESFAEQTNKLRSQLTTAVQELREISEEIGIDSVELALLETVSFARLDYLSYGSQLMLTRMMPPPVSEQTDELLPQIETRIDTVIKLRESGLIDNEEMTIAFENLISCIDTYCVLRIISRGTFYSSPAWSFRWPEEVNESTSVGQVPVRLHIPYRTCARVEAPSHNHSREHSFSLLTCVILPVF